MKKTQTLLKLLDKELLDFMEGHAKVRIGDKREWLLQLDREERRHFRETKLRYRNLQPDPDNPMKFVLYKA